MIEIFRAKLSDALEFYKLEAKCFEMEEDNEDTTYYWVPILSYQCCLKAVVDGKIVGGLVSMPTFEGKWYLNSLFVDPECRRRGIADKLMEKMKELATQDVMMLDVKTDRPFLVQFYERHGFKLDKTSVNHYHDDSDRFIMVRDALKI